MPNPNRAALTAPAYEVWPDDRLAPGQWLVPWTKTGLTVGAGLEIVVARTKTPIPCTVTGHLGPYPVATEVQP